MQAANAAPQMTTGSEGGQVIRVVGTRTFLLNEGVWTDTNFDPQKTATQKIQFLSLDYFNLIQARPDLAAALALGEQVIVVVDGSAYQIVPAGETTAPVTLPTLSATPTGPAANRPTVTAQVKPSVTPVSIVQVVPVEPGGSKSNNQCLGVTLPFALVISVWGWQTVRRKRR